MADIADVCEVDRERQCDFELRQEPEIDDPSIGIIPEIESGPVLAGPPVVTGPLTQCSVVLFQQYNFRPLTNFTNPKAADDAAAAVDRDPAPTEIEQREREGFVESDEVSSNTTEDITTGTYNPLLVSFQIMEFIESQIKKDLLDPFNKVFEELYKGLSDVVPNLHDVNATKGFVGINRCGFLSKYTTVIYYAGRIPFSYRLAIVTLTEHCNTHIKKIIEKWSVGSNIAFTCKVEKSQVQYDTQKIILCIRLATNNVIQIPILNVVGFPVFEDVTPLLGLLGCVNPQSLPCFFTPQLAYDFIGLYPDQFTAFIVSQQHGKSIAYAFIIGHPTQFTEFIGLRPDSQRIASDFIIEHPTQFTQFIGSRPEQAKIIASDFIAAYPTEFTEFTRFIALHPQAQYDVSAFMTAYPTQFTQFITSRADAQSIASDFIAANPQVFTRFIALQHGGLSIASDFIAANPQVFTQFIASQQHGIRIASDFMRRYPADFTQFIASQQHGIRIASDFMRRYPVDFTKFITSQPHSLSIASAFIAANTQEFTKFIALQPRASCELQSLSLLDIIVRVRLCANQGAITALSEPSKEEVTLILSCFKGLTDRLPELIPTITQSIRTTLYTVDNIKPFALFCNIFYNFINVSLGHRSLAKIIYSDFFSKSDNYGKVIRACQVVNNLPIMLHHVAFFLTGSNAARVYLALNKILKNWEAIQLDQRLLTQILNETFGNLSDNDFMIYLKGPESEEYRVFIRMILGGSFYFFKDLFDPVTLAKFTAMMTQSAGIVGFMDHLFAQRFDATWQFLLECYKKDPTSFLAHIQPLMAEYFQHLDKQINVAQFDGVFKHYTLKGFYTKMFEICGITAPDYVYVFLIDHATSINCIATVWTLVLNVLYTLFVPENCLARMVVGKFDNDPKNLKLYMEILNDHLTELQSLPGNGKEFIDTINKLQELQTTIAHMCEVGIKRDLLLFKQTCDQWVQSMVSAVAQSDGPSNYKGLFMLSESDAYKLGSRFPTKLERALCLAYLPTSRGNICSAASPTGPYIFIEQILKIVDLETKHIEGILSSEYAKTLATEDIRMDLLQRLKNGGVNDGNLNRLILNPDSLQKDPFLVPVNEATIFIDLFKKAPRKPLISLSGTDNLAKILTSLTGNSADTTTLLERLKHFGVNDDNLNALGNVESSLIQKNFHMQEPLAKAFIGLCRQQLPIVGIVDQSEIELYPRLTALGSQMKVFLEATRTISITIKPEITTSQLSNYLNLLWKHLTKTAIRLKIFFKENLTDIKRVTGIKYIALVLGGYFQIRLLVDDVSEQCRPDKRGELESFKTSQEMMLCKRGLLPLLIEPPILDLIKAIIQMDPETRKDYTVDPVPLVLKILGFLFSIKVKSSSPHSPYQLLRLEDSILIFPFPKDPPDPRGLQILNPTSGMFIDFLRALGVPINKETMKCICRPKDDVLKIDIGFSQALKSYNLEGLYTAMGGGNNLESNSGRKSVSSLNKHKHKYKHNKLSRNNHTRKNKYKRNNKNKNKKHKSSTKYRKINPSSRSGSQSNKKKSKSKITHKSVTFKRRRYNK